MEAADEILYGEEENRIVKIKKYLKDYEDSLRSVVVMDGRLGAYDLKRVLGTEENVFPNPKPVDLLLSLVSFATEPGDLVLDFFAGSGTTAEAVLRLNDANGGARTFILVQLPEPLAEDSVGKRAGFRYITKIAEERIRRVIAQRQKPDDPTLAPSPPRAEIGLRVFSLRESHYRVWAGPERTDDPGAYEQRMQLHIDPLVPGWEAQSVIWEAAIKEGYSLSSRIERVGGIESNAVYRVTDPEKGQSFRICLDDALDPPALKALALGKDDLFICRDKALDDTLAANLALQCRLKVL
ncbi:MAG TPA: DNA methyltransferase [Terriglobia bacterium]|nr:DNA methyltransferase [Terriglobia bacterium]